MLTIRGDQLRALQRSGLEEFVSTAQIHLLTHLPGPSSSLGAPSEVRNFVLRGVERARSFQVETKGAVLALLELWVQFGENFERSPLRLWTLKFLAHPLVPGDAKVDTIRDRHAELTGGSILIPF